MHQHNHSHDHSHGHSHGAPKNRTRLLIVLAVTASVFIIEAVGAWWSGSLALLADAAHVFVDSSGLVVAAIAAHLMTKPASDTRTWGYLRMEVVGAALQAGMLLVICISIAVQAASRLFTPETLDPQVMGAVGLVGLIGNIISLLILLSDRHANLNMRAAFLEVATDTLGSVAVVIAAVAVWATGFIGIDAIVSLLIAAMMAPRALLLLRDSVTILLESTPRGLDLEEVRKHILRVEHVVEVHDLHASTITTGLIDLSAHIIVEDRCLTTGHSQEILSRLQRCVAEHFPISVAHSTFQIESKSHRDQEILSHTP